MLFFTTRSPTAASCWLLFTLRASTTSFSSNPISINAMTAYRGKQGLAWELQAMLNFDWMKPHTLESGLNSRFLRILLKISVSSSCRLLSSVLDWLDRLRKTLGPEAEDDVEGPAVAAAVAPASVEESWPGIGASTEGSSTCSISHSIAWVTDILKGGRKMKTRKATKSGSHAY